MQALSALAGHLRSSQAGEQLQSIGATFTNAVGMLQAREEAWRGAKRAQGMEAPLLDWFVPTTRNRTVGVAPHSCLCQ